jgi:hypothetical protein
MIGDESAWKLRSGLASERVVEVLLIGPLSDFGDISIIDLDFVMDLIGGKGARSQDRQSCCCDGDPIASPTSLIKNGHLAIPAPGAKSILVATAPVTKPLNIAN